ncbi:MAG: peptide chain release factor N(5)-glutamine methyltransferase [Chloroflexi bacterium]|nr:peptide chain release factor N(5)-glutamine methyltransferase [Chloroflexota bacterium]
MTTSTALNLTETATPRSNGHGTSGSFVWSLDRSSDVGRAVLAATRRLQEVGADSPQLDAAVLMAHVLGVNKAWIYAYPNRPLAENEIARFEALVRRRMNHEPVAYLVGFKSFYGLDITVDRRVLIPRPETELLVERALEWVRSLVQQGIAPRVADIGTGSGAIAVAIAANAPEAVVYATDLSEGALAVAAQNIWRYGVGEQVQLLPGRLTEPLPEPVHVLIANLPYVTTPALAGLPPQVRDYEPMLALDGGPDGLRIIADLLGELARPAGRSKLQPGARIYLEIGADQGETAHALAQGAFPAAEVAVLYDYADLPRVVLISS